MEMRQGSLVATVQIGKSGFETSNFNLYLDTGSDYNSCINVNSYGKLLCVLALLWTDSVNICTCELHISDVSGYVHTINAIG